MTYKPQISVLIAVYNDPKGIAQTLDSLLNQTFEEFEIILVNDASTDNTTEIIEQFLKKDKRIVLLTNERNTGLTKSLNRGIKLAKGRYISRIDSGDICLKNRLEVQKDILDNSDATLVASPVIVENERGNTLYRSKAVLLEGDLRTILTKKNIIYHSSITFKNESISYREKFVYSQDYDLYLRLITNDKKIVMTPQYLVRYVKTKNSISFNASLAQDLFAEKAREFYRERIKYGNDSYSSLEPGKILEKKLSDVKIKSIWENQIKKDIKNGKGDQARTKIKDYWKKFGYDSETTIYLIASFLGTLPNRLFRLSNRS